MCWLDVIEAFHGESFHSHQKAYAVPKYILNNLIQLASRSDGGDETGVETVKVDDDIDTFDTP